ncbi:MAG: hypothetical protein NZ989_06395 [Bacteroidia bacterium]|nr:hypothetical protein [Bacteroidia bacterium]MDW8057901.1 hypothetical protein [Bacteroidia bacterium]
MNRLRWMVGAGLLCLSWGQAPETTPVPFTLADRDRLIRVEARVEALEKRINALEKQVEARFTALEKRVEGLEQQVEARFTAIEKQLEMLTYLFIGLFSGFVALVVGVLGMLWWVVQDRRKVLRPIEESVEEYRRVMAVLRKRARDNPELAAFLDEAGVPIYPK